MGRTVRCAASKSWIELIRVHCAISLQKQLHITYVASQIGKTPIVIERRCYVARQTDYRLIAPVFDERYQRNDYTDTEHALRVFLDSDDPLQILDAGCGTGYWSTRLASGRRRIIGLDSSSEMLSHARTRSRKSKLVHSTAEMLPFANNSFDRVFCLNSFHHFIDKEAFIREAWRVLRLGGGFMTIGLDPHAGLDRWWIYDYFQNTLELDRQRYPSGRTIRELLSATGFNDCHTSLVQHLPRKTPARDSLARGELARTVTSQLAMLTDEEYNRGLDAIQQAISAADVRGEELFLISDLRLYATIAYLK
jgi:SAM-dependent methyltransferase